jgi:hypothetical protein
MGATETFLAVLRKTFLFWQKKAKSDSLVSYTKSTRVEPICIIDSRALHLSYTHDILQSMNSLFAGFYLQAAALSTNIGKINVGAMLGHLNPDQQSRNTALEHLLATPVSPQEDYRFGLPKVTPRPGLESLAPGTLTALEAFEGLLNPDGSANIEKSWAYGSHYGEKLGNIITPDDSDNSLHSHHTAKPFDGEQPEPFQATHFDEQPYVGTTYTHPEGADEKDYKAARDKHEYEEGYRKREHEAAEKTRRGEHDAAELHRKQEHEKKVDDHRRAKQSHDDSERMRTASVSVAFSDNLGKGLAEAGNLSVGRTYTVDITDAGHKASIPVQIRLLTTECDSGLLVHILSDQAKVKTSTAKERAFGFKLGELKFWKDIVFATDLIDEHKKAMLADKTGVYKEIMNRRAAGHANDARAFFDEGHLSVGTASSLVVTTRQTIKDLETVLGGKWSDFNVRQKVFDRSYLMIVAVADPDYDHVTFYYRGIELPTELSVKDIKKAGKDSNADIMALMQALQQGSAPRF